LPVRVLGIDPSLVATGLALPGGSRFVTLRSNSSDEISKRLHELYNSFSAIVHSLRNRDLIDVAMIEAVMPSSTQSVARKRLAQLSGVLLLALYESAVPYVEVGLSSVKKYATEKGTAEKHEMVLAAKSAGAAVANDNEADAYWLHRIGDDFYNLSVEDSWLALTDYQRSLHDRIDWPRL
jgi:crossover junction endodeoxyribonuclease RuvC